MKKNGKKTKISVILTSVFGTGLLLSSVIAPTVIYSIAKPIYFNQDWRPEPSYQRIHVSSIDRNDQNMNKIVRGLTFDQIKNDLMFSTFVWAHKYVEQTYEPYQEWTVKLLNIKWNNDRLSYQVEINYPYFDNWESVLPDSNPWLHRKIIINVTDAELLFQSSDTLSIDNSPFISNSVYYINNESIKVKVYQDDRKLLSKTWQIMAQWQISSCCINKLYSYTIDSDL